MLILLAFAFLSGVVTIAAPCIWPLLPIVLSSSSLEGHRRPFGLTLGILVSFGVITLSISYLVHLLGLDASLLRTLAVVVLAFLGATLLLPRLSELVEGWVSRFSGNATWAASGTGFWPGFVSGLPLGIVWAPCAGPILATIATLAATRDVGISIVLVTAAYLIGIGIPLFLFSYVGQHFLHTAKAFSRHTATLQRVFGVVIIATAGLILFNLDTKLEADLLTAIPSYSDRLTKFESNSSVTKQLDKLRGNRPPAAEASSSSLPMPAAKDVLNLNYAAPDFRGVNKWLNLPDGQAPPSLAQYKGKVVLIDFWTYTCINCIRALPHVKAWYDQYHDAGLEVIGVHTPEFQFEHDTGNVQSAIQRFGIKYPVAQDNDYGTWKAFRNQYWPAEYLIDKDGNVRLAEFGEGKTKYDRTEQAIRLLLSQAGAKLPMTMTDTPDQTPNTPTSPETYLGADTMQSYFPSGNIGPGAKANLMLDPKLSINAFDFGGSWNIEDDYSESFKDSAVEFNFHAQHVYLVAHAPKDGPGQIKISLDGKPIDPSIAGPDVKDGVITVDSHRLYDLLYLKGDNARHILHLDLTPGIQLYTFDFG